MLGLDGVYSDVLVENKPFLRGLAASYGLNYIPGSWIESIQIAKATGSVTNGFQALTGQINTELYKPETIDGFFWNSYLSSVEWLKTTLLPRLLWEKTGKPLFWDTIRTWAEVLTEMAILL